MSNLITTIETDVETVFHALLPNVTLQHLALQAIPESIYRPIYTIGVKASAAAGQALIRLAANGLTNEPLYTFLSNAKASLDVVLLPPNGPAGSAVVVWIINELPGLLDALTVTNTTLASVTEKAVALQQNPDVANAQATTIAAQAAEIAALKAAIAQMTPPPTQDFAPQGEAMTPGEPAAG